MKKTALASLALFALPLFAFAQALQPLRNLVLATGNILNLLIPVLIAAALVVFFWGLVQYIRNPAGGGEGHGPDGRKTMIAGLVSLFIMVSVFGIISLAQNALGVNSGAGATIPQVPTVQ